MAEGSYINRFIKNIENILTLSTRINRFLDGEDSIEGAQSIHLHHEATVRERISSHIAHIERLRERREAKEPTRV